MHPHSQRFAPRQPRGAILIVVMLIMAIIAVVLGSYLSLNLTTSRLANRSYCANTAFGLAEAGAEEALWSFNQTAAGSSSAWTSWQRNGTAAWNKFTDFDLSPNTTGWVKVYVDNNQPAGGARPKIVALGSVSPANGVSATKMLEVTLQHRSLFAGGLVARESVTFRGANASVDSWNSDPDHDSATPALPYSFAARRDRGSVASTSVLNNAAQVNEAHVWGYVATGGAQPEVGSNGSIRGADTPADVRIDPARIATDFTANFPPAVAPGDGIPVPSITSSVTLGTAGRATSWRCPVIKLAGSDTLTVQGDVTLVLTAGPASQAISVTGRASIVVPAGASLALFVEGDVLIAGNGLANANPTPVSCLIWGTNTSIGGQDLQIAGNGALGAALYAPNGAVTVNGNGDVMGAIVAATITLTGNADFHFDESLGTYGTTTPYGVARWRELTTHEARQAYEAVFAGW
jgi:hypothetical protein